MSERDDAQKVMRYDAERIVDEVIQERVDKAIYQLIGKRVKEATESLYDYVDNVVADIKTPNSPRGEVRYFGGSLIHNRQDSSSIDFLQSGTGATATDLQTWGRARAVNLIDFLPAGYVTDGSIAYTTQIQNWLNKGGKLIAPVGTWLCGNVTPVSNSEIEGFGPESTIFKVANSTNNDLFALSAKSNVTFRNFKISGNSANQTSGSAIHVSGASTDIVCQNVLIDDHYDWGFYFEQVTRARLFNCGATNGRAGASANAVRGGFLFGTSIGPTAANDIECFGCYSTGSNNFVDGFLSEDGTDHRFIGCRTAVAYTGFKIKGDNVVVSGCYATGGVQGYQTQTSSKNLVFTGNIAYRCNDSGFYINNSDTTANLTGLVLTGNMAVENGQSPASTSYGFAFEAGASCTIDQVVIADNFAIDNQVSHTQTRGISFGASGTVSNIHIADNFCKGNTIDLYTGGASLSTTTVTYGPNSVHDGNSTAYAPGQASHALHFWVNAPTASTTATLMSDGFSGRGYVMPKAGWVRGIYCKSDSAVTAASISIVPRKNNSNFTANLTVSSGTYNSEEETPMTGAAFSAGDLITCVYSTTSGFLPSGSANFDVVVEVVY